MGGVGPGGGGRVGGGQGGWERRIEAFVKIPKNIYIFFFWGGPGRGGRGWGGGGWGSKVWGRWVMWGMGDVNQE